MNDVSRAEKGRRIDFCGTNVKLLYLNIKIDLRGNTEEPQAKLLSEQTFIHNLSYYNSVCELVKGCRIDLYYEGI